MIGHDVQATSNFTDVLIQGGRGLDTALTYDPSVQKTVRCDDCTWCVVVVKPCDGAPSSERVSGGCVSKP